MCGLSEISTHSHHGHFGIAPLRTEIVISTIYTLTLLYCASSMGPKAKGQVQQGPKILCHCVKKCGGPGGVGKSWVYSTVMKHRKADIPAVSPEFTQFLHSEGSGATSSRSPSAALPPESRSPSPAAIASHQSDRRPGGRKSRHEDNLTSTDDDGEEDRSEGRLDRRADDMDQADGLVGNTVCTF